MTSGLAHKLLARPHFTIGSEIDLHTHQDDVRIANIFFFGMDVVPHHAHVRVKKNSQTHLPVASANPLLVCEKRANISVATA